MEESWNLDTHEQGQWYFEECRVQNGFVLRGLEDNAKLWS